MKFRYIYIYIVLRTRSIVKEKTILILSVKSSSVQTVTILFTDFLGEHANEKVYMYTVFLNIDFKFKNAKCKCKQNK